MKTIRTPADLAINGAEKAFDTPLHVGRPNISNKALFIEYVETILDNNWLTNNGPFVQELESHIANLHNTKHCVAMCNGTIALEIAIRALELSGEVILPSFTFVATAHALHWQGITPVFADINPISHCIDPASAEECITNKTSGIIGVHLWGNGADADELQHIADAHNLKLLFDGAHAFGNSYQGKMIGQFGEAEVLSFHATKLFNTFEGGAVLTNNDSLAEKMRLMRNFGFAGFDNVILPGTNGKMSEIAAAMGLANLTNLQNVIQHNRENYEAYERGLKGINGVKLSHPTQKANHNCQYVVLSVSNECPVTRDQFIAILTAENVMARRYFWPGCHNMEPYRTLYPHIGKQLPNTEKVASEVVVLPTGTQIGPDEISLVCEIIRAACKYSDRNL